MRGLQIREEREIGALTSNISSWFERSVINTGYNARLSEQTIPKIEHWLFRKVHKEFFSRDHFFFRGYYTPIDENFL